MQVSFNMSLTIWDVGADAYDHGQLAANWQAVDVHDHSPGRGKPIPTAGLADDAVTRIKLANNAVTTAEILNKTILGEDIADGTLDLVNFSSGALNGVSPLGQVIAWWRPNLSFSIPTGWVLCNGQTVVDHGWAGVGSIVVPDLRNRFILGADTSGTGTGTGTPPAENATGGSHSRTFAHTHTVAGHSHTVNSHSHVVDAHSHVVDAHGHGIGADGDHSHNMHSRLNAFLQGLTFRDINTFVRNNSLQSVYVAGFNNNSVDDPVPASGAHSHGGGTGAAAPGTSLSAPSTSAVAPGTNSVSLTTDSTAAGGDIRPSFTGLLYIIKVKHV